MGKTGRHRDVQGTTKRLRPGLVNMSRENFLLLAAAGRRTQFFLPHDHPTWPMPFRGALYYVYVAAAACMLRP